MQIYFLGYIVIPIGLLYFFYAPKKLYELTIFSIPFTGSAIFQISVSTFSIEGIRPSMFLGALCLLRHAILLSTRKVSMRRRLRNYAILILLIAFAAVASLIMPVLINGGLDVLDTYGNLIMYAEPKPLYFKFQYATQVAYFVFGCLFAYYVAFKNVSASQLQRSVEIYLYASFFACCWGIVELALFYLHVPYPSFIFNANQNSMNFAGTLTLNGIPRIISVALEPSVLAQQLLTTVPLLFWPIWAGGSEPFKFKGWGFLFLTFIVLLLSLSATAVSGLCVFVAIMAIIVLKKRKVNFYFTVAIILSSIGLLLASPFLFMEFIEKLASFSGIERLKAIQFGWSYFSQYPIFGIGWGVFPSWDLIVCILTGMGLLGLLLFISLFGTLLNGFRTMERQGTATSLTRSIVFSFVVIVIVSQFSGFLYYTQYFWLILGLAMAATSLQPEVHKDLDGNLK